MPQHLYKQLEEVYQRGVNKEHKPNPARMHPMSSRQGKGCPEMPINQTEPAQYSQGSQSDSDHVRRVLTFHTILYCHTHIEDVLKYIFFIMTHVEIG